MNTNAQSILWTVFLAMLVCAPVQAADTQVHVIPDSQLNQWWQTPSGYTNALPRYPIDALRKGVAGCVTAAFRINADGSVSNERIWKSHLNVALANNPFSTSILAALQKWHFAPAATNDSHDPVYTYHVFTFTLLRLPEASRPPKTDTRTQVGKFRAKCEMTDFPQQVQAFIKSKQAGAKP